jgi:hypothetical protein
MGSPAPLLVIGSLLSQGVVTTVPPSGTHDTIKAVAESIDYDPVVDFTIDTMTLGVEGNDHLMLQVVTVHRGQRMIAPPKVVELLVVREFPDAAPDDIQTICDREFKLIVNGEAFERLGIRNLRHVDRRNAGAVAIVFPADTFSRLAHAISVQGKGCGAAFALNPEQLLGMQSLVDRWPHP